MIAARHLLPALAVALALAVGDAGAAAADYSEALSGRLARIKETRTVRLGYRDGAIPFSYVGREPQPVGYSLDVCAAVAATIADDLGIGNLAVDYVRVSAQDRVDRVVSGAVDLECGSTTNTAERRRRVAFSPTIFVTGTRLAVTRTSAIRSVAGIKAKRVAVVRGTTNETAMREVDRLRGLGVAFVVADDYPGALAMLAGGNADALAADEILLRGLLAETGRTAEFRIVGEALSFEPYGIMYPRDDPALADAVDRTLHALAASREILWIYDRWFVRRLPSGGRIGLPMGTELRRSLELIGLPPD